MTFDRVGGKRSDFGNGTLQTIQPAVFQNLRAIRDGSRCHLPLALGTKRTVDWAIALGRGFLQLPITAEKLEPNQNICLSGTRLSP